MMKILFIGPKIQDLGGFDGSPIQDGIKKAIRNKLQELSGTKDLHVLSSLNLGIETWAAEIADELKVNTHVYIPFDSPHSKWPQSSKKNYLYLLKKARKRIVISEEPYTAKAFHECKNRMIEDADIIYHFFPMDDYNLKVAAKLEKECVYLETEEDDDFYIRF